MASSQWNFQVTDNAKASVQHLASVEDECLWWKTGFHKKSLIIGIAPSVGRCLPGDIL